MAKRLFSLFFFSLYALLLFKVMVLKDVPMIRIGDLMLNFGGTQHGTSNLVPFTTIAAYFDGHKGFLIASINLLGNVVLLVPIGFLFPLAFVKYNWSRILLLSVFSGTAIELLQLILKVGIFDIDDVILNSLGVVVGFILFLLCKKLAQHISLKNKIIAIALVAVFVVSAIGVFYYRYGKFPIQFEHIDQNGQQIFPGYKDKENTMGKDPCNGSGGTGEITKVNTKSFSIKRNDGMVQDFLFLHNTTFKSAAGDITRSALKIGDRVTIVTGPDAGTQLTAAFILVCGADIPAKSN